MPRITILPDDVADRIAAGEVVERPASVVKELVENSLDAGATRIEVSLTEGGLRLIEVSDNGCGMDESDLVLCVQRFATSKISASEDLETVATMGFRGEALPSIAAVSQMRIITRQAEAAEGLALTVEGGEPTSLEAVGCPVGTTIRVANLFYNTPARLKFCATTATERGHCQEWVQRLALARPDVKFKLTHSGTTLFTTSGSGDLRSVLSAVYGSASAREFLPVTLESRGLRISGQISGPRLTRATRQHQLFFVNRRFVRSRALGAALIEAYGLLLPAGRNPLCAIAIEMDPAAVDPNVHPTKIEVRFRSPAEVFNLTRQAVEAALAEAGYRSLIQRVPASEGRRPSGLPTGRIALPDEEQRGRIRRLRLNRLAEVLDRRDDGLGVYGESPDDALAVRPGPAARPAEATEGARVLGQHAARYIIVQLGDDLLLIDQHRAAERVAYEAMGDRAGGGPLQYLIVPLTIELSPSEMAAAQAHLEALGDLGFVVEPFGATALLLRAAPAWMTARNVEQATRDLVENLAQHGATGRLGTEQLRATAACHGALRAGEKLAAPEMERLVRDLLRTQAPATCPHGDPIIVTLAVSALDRQFGRTGGQGGRRHG